ncbi:hypothetical protein AAG906_012131 [Vitis piasezkii]
MGSNSLREPGLRSSQGDDVIEMNRLKSCLAIEFELKDLGSMKYFLGMEVAHSKKAMEICKGTPVDIVRYQRLVGKLIYLSHSWLDIAFAVSVVSQFMHAPYEEHLEAVY